MAISSKQTKWALAHANNPRLFPLKECMKKGKFTSYVQFKHVYYRATIDLRDKQLFT